MPKSKHLRHLPQQARSRQRFNQILSTAAKVFEEVGYEAASTEIIAMRANTSIGSLYRFFPDKSSILYSLAEKYGREQKELIAKSFNSDTVNKSLAEVVSDAVDAFDEFYAHQPAIRIIFLQSHAAPEIKILNRRVDDEIALLLDEFFAIKQPNMEPEQRRVVALVTVEVAAALQLFYFDKDENFRKKLAEETKNVLIRYLQPLFPDD